jgi:hypothetical protein
MTWSSSRKSGSFRALRFDVVELGRDSEGAGALMTAPENVQRGPTGEGGWVRWGAACARRLGCALYGGLGQLVGSLRPQQFAFHG